MFDPRKTGRIIVRIDALKEVLTQVKSVNDMLYELDVQVDEENIILTIERLQSMLEEEYAK
jgi:hypothetical protein